MNIARNLEIYYSNYNLLYTTDSNSNMTSSNILNLEGNVISSTRNDNNFYAYNKDSRNSTSSIVDKNNNGVVTYKYSDFGETEQLGNQEFDNEICYTGGIYDKETGEYYLNARHYDPSIARFTSVDTYRGETEEPLSLHLYAYCANNPINFVDPSGHWPLEIGHFKGSMSYNSRYAWLKIKITHTRRGKIYRIVMTWGNLIVSFSPFLILNIMCF